VTRPSRRTLAIGGVGAALLVAVMIARDNEPGDSAPAPARQGAGPAAAPGAVPVADVKLELLDRTRPELEEAKRNLFRFQPRPAPAAAPGPRAQAPVAAPVVPRVMVPSGPTPPPPPPPIPVRFIGLVDAPSQVGRLAILADGRGTVFTVKEGDIIEGRYKVLKLSLDAVELSYIDGRGRQTIRLSGQ
jgi:hypothetical protein